MGKILKHDRYQQELCDRLRPLYDNLETNVTLYSKRRRKVAEIDVIAYAGEYYDIYEVKCSYRITKARMQLEKIKKLIAQENKLRHTYFFCGATGTITNV